MVEIMHMRHKSGLDTRFVDGLVLDHGARHPGMAKRSENCFIFICNVSLEYEKSEVNAGFFYKSAEERKKLVEAERKFTDDKVREIIAFKNKVCSEADAKAKKEGKDLPPASFIIINQKGIDPISLDLLQKAGIVGIRRAKRRNMERLARACGGYAVNSLVDIDESCLGRAGLVYEHTLGDDKFTFVEQCHNPTSCSILITGPNDHTIAQIKDSVRDGLRAIKNAIDDKALVPGAGCFEVAAYCHLQKFVQTVEGRTKLGVTAFANALLVIPNTLARNSGLDVQDCIIKLTIEATKGHRVGLCVDTGKPILPEKLGIWDNVKVKRQVLHLGSLIGIKLLLVDEVMRAGRKMGKG